MTFLNTQNILFSLKSYVGAMLALFVAFSLDLDRPYWAFISAYIISQPLTGAVLSKAVYRIFGSFLGSAATVIMIPNFVNEPIFLSIILSLWISACLYISGLDRTPRSYFFFLAGYTAAIVGFPAVSAPDNIFNDAVSRFEEISLGILGATLVHSLFFPQEVTPVFSKNMDLWWSNVKKIMSDICSRKPDQELASSWQSLASGITQLYTLSTHLAFEATNLRVTSIILALDERMTNFLATLYIITDRLYALRHEPSSELTELILKQFRLLLSTDLIQFASGDKADENIEKMKQFDKEIKEHSTWFDILKKSLITHFDWLNKLYHECGELRGYLFSDEKIPPNRDVLLRTYKNKIRPLHLDRYIAFLSSLAAFMSIMFICLFWIATAWPYGSAAAVLAAIACCFFANQVDPVPFLLVFILVVILAIPIAAFYLFVVLTRVNDFFMLALTLAPYFLVAGVLMAVPRTILIGTAAVLSLPNLILFQNGYSSEYEFDSFMNTSIALLIGMGCAALFSYFCRSFGKEWNIKRLLMAIRIDLAKMASSDNPSNVTVFTLRTVDRLGLLMALKIDPKTNYFLLLQGLRSLSIGQDITHLQYSLKELPPHIRNRVCSLLDELAQHYRRHKLHQYDKLSDKLLGIIDSALKEVVSMPENKAKNEALLGLCGLRRNLFPEAVPYNYSS